MSLGQDTPKDISDAMPYAASTGSMDTTQRYTPAANFPADMAQKLARDCYESSTQWINSGRRLKWSDSLRAFQSMHANSSKYLSNDYKYRSRLYRPKTRTMVRTSEAETANAFFSNEDVVSIAAQNDNDKQQQASAEIMKELLQYRLTKTIPWFLTLVGARQDAEVMGICIGKAYWKYSERLREIEKRPRLDPFTSMHMQDEAGEHLHDEYEIYEKVDDHPWVDLVAPENFRFDPGADWRNPVATSPYIIEMIPMYVCDVRAKIESGEWLDVAESSILGSTDLEDDTTRRAREQGRVPGKDNDIARPRDYDICWVRENVMRYQGRDWHYYTLSSAGELLTMPKPLEDVYFQGVRPWVCGNIVVEAHKTYPSGKVELVRDLQMQANDVVNLRLDNVKLALNPRQFVKSGQGIDPQDLRIFNPGKVVILPGDPRQDITWDRPPEVTASAYQEQDRINIDFDELSGTMTSSSIQANKHVFETAANMEMMQGNASKIGEYEQRVFVETFVEPLIRQLIKLEQAYETDPVILSIAGQNAKLLQKFGMNQITDELLRQELTTRVNVGIGATNPQTKLKNFSTAGELVAAMFGPIVAQGADFQEVVKEIFSLCGYKDGSRFFKPGFDPQKAMQEQQQQQGAGQHATINDPSKVEAANISAQAKLQDSQIKADTQMQLGQMDFKQAQLHEQAETHRKMMDILHKPQPAAMPGMEPHPALTKLRSPNYAQ